MGVAAEQLEVVRPEETTVLELRMIEEGFEVRIARTLAAVGCRLLAYDVYPSDAFKQWGEYVSLQELLNQSDVISLHCPLTEETHHLVDARAIDRMPMGAYLVNTARFIFGAEPFDLADGLHGPEVRVLRVQVRP